ncbi:MAG: hypothetical protein QM640_05585, partial [Niabella sp.]
MKKIVIIISLLWGLTDVSHAQTEAAQKTQQEWIYQHRAEYIGQPFSLLYNALTIKPQSVWGGDAHWNRYIEPNHKFFYRDTANYADTAYYFYIEWQEGILISETKKYQPMGFRAFNAQEYPTYADKIIKKLEV